MFSETWSKIRAAIEAEIEKENLDKIPKTSYLRLPTPYDDKEERKHIYRDPFLRIIEPILEEVRLNYEPIVNAKQSRIVRLDRDDPGEPGWVPGEVYIYPPVETSNTLLLQWGNKLEPTDEELRLIKTDKRPMFYPSKIIVKDCKFITIQIIDKVAFSGNDSNYLTIGVRDFELKDLIRDQSIITPVIAHELLKPHQTLLTYHYHKKYWHDIQTDHKPFIAPDYIEYYRPRY